MLFKSKAETRPAFVRLGDSVMVDALEVSAIYEYGDRIVIRVGGKGLIDIHRKHLKYTVSECIDLIFKAVN